MARILLINFDDQLSARLAAFLRTQRHDVCVAIEDRNFSQIFKQYVLRADLLIVDVSHREKYVRDLLRKIALHRARKGPRPMVLCISRVYRGPRFELDLERKGARLLYV